MAVPSSGQLREYADIGVEIGVAQSNVSLRGMSQTAGFSAPDAMSEFYGYSSSTTGQLDFFGDGSCIAAFELDNNLNNLAGGAGTGGNFTYVTGQFSQAIKGSTSYNSYTDLNGVPNRLLVNSVSFWFNRPAGQANGEKIIFWLRDGLHTWIGFNNNLLVTRTFDGSTESLSNGISVNNNQWYHFCLVHNGSTKSIYLNGANYQNYSQGDYNTADANAKTTIFHYDSSGISTSSAVDQVRIFDKALSATEVNTLFLSGLNGNG